MFGRSHRQPRANGHINLQTMRQQPGGNTGLLLLPAQSTEGQTNTVTTGKASAENKSGHKCPDLKLYSKVLEQVKGRVEVND